MQLWRERAQADGSRRWTSQAIPEAGIALAFDASGALWLGEEASGECRVVARLVPVSLRGAREVALVVAPGGAGLLVEGFAPLGVSLLDDRAELAIAGERLCLARFAAAGVERFEAEGEERVCSRCTRALRPGDCVLRCGACGGLHHEGARAGGAEELRCASYDPRCAGCRRAWEAIHWTPEEAAR